MAQWQRISLVMKRSPVRTWVLAEFDFLLLSPTFYNDFLNLYFASTPQRLRMDIGWHGAVVTHFTCNEKIPSSNLGVS